MLSLFCKVLPEVFKRHAVALEAEACVGFDTGHARIGYLPEGFSCRDVGDMHLDRRQGNGLEGIEDGNACMGVGGGIDDDAVVYPVGLLYLIDDIHRAVSENSSIEFKYTDLTPSKKRVRRKNGESYRVSPWSLMWREDNYYLIAFDHESMQIRHYRVDRMEDIRLSGEKRLGKEEFEKISLAKYYGNVFEMFKGREEIVRFRCKNAFAGAMLDRFGMSLSITECGDFFEFYAPVEISVRFFSWVFGFDGALQILSPENVVCEYKEQLKRSLFQFEKNDNA